MKVSICRNSSANKITDHLLTRIPGEGFEFTKVFTARNKKNNDNSKIKVITIITMMRFIIISNFLFIVTIFIHVAFYIFSLVLSPRCMEINMI